MSEPAAPQGENKNPSNELLSTNPLTGLEALVAAEVKRQLDTERSLIKEASGIALKIIGVAFALLFGMFTLFGISTWKDIKREATDYVKRQIEELIQKSDSETGVRQQLNDLFNRAIVSSSVVRIRRNPHLEFELQRNEWNRLKSWIKNENLETQDFQDVLAVLNAQSPVRKALDTHSLFSLTVAPTMCSSLREPHKLRLRRHQAPARACRNSSL